MDTGKKEEVEELLKTAPEAMSKAQKKKLLKQAEINLKKLEKQSNAKPAAAPSAKKSAAAEKAASSAPAAAAAPSSGVAGKAETAIVDLLLARMQAMGLPAEALDLCRERRGDLSVAIVPALNALRNDAYTTGFNARLT